MSRFFPKTCKPCEKTYITIRIDNNLLDEIEKLSYQCNLSRNAFIVQCIEFALTHQGEKNEP